MKYFLLGPKDTEESAHFEANELGESSFDSFYPGSALKVLMEVTHTRPELLEHFTILNEQKEKLSIAQFLERIDKLKIRRDYNG
tara:strand:+ start:2645 stop:2896 length:252 start_codon:yes stop_codon:yes gene_type:complete